MRLVILIVSALLVSACASSVHQRKSSETIGVAEMKLDRTIVLRLRAEGPNDLHGEGYFEYRTSDPDYQKILEHVGPIEPGQTVSVRPWPKVEKKAEPGATDNPGDAQ